MDVGVGDVIEVHSSKVGAAVRRGTVLEVTEAPRLQLRVRWDDERESVLYPSGGMVQVVEQAQQR